MKKFLSLLFCLSLTFTLFAQGYKVTFQTSSYKSGLAYLACHMGKNYNIADSAIVSSNGVAIFTGPKPLLPGIYAIAFPNKTLTADFLIDKEQQITVKADTNRVGMIVTGSPANLLFEDYQRVVVEKSGKMIEAKNAYASAKTKQDSLIHERTYNQYNEE